MLFLEARVQVQALDKSLHLKQPLRAEGLEQTELSGNQVGVQELQEQPTGRRVPESHQQSPMFNHFFKT